MDSITVTLETVTPLFLGGNGLISIRGMTIPRCANRSRDGAIRFTSVPEVKRSRKRSRFPATVPGAGWLNGRTPG